MRLKTFYVVLLLLLTTLAVSKRSGGGRRRGSSSGSSSFWNRKNGKSSSTPQKTADTPFKPVGPPATQTKTAPKPSAPKEAEIKKENVNLQQSAPPNSGRPIGWDVNNNKDGFSAQKQNVNPSYASGNYPQSGAYPGHNPAGGYAHNPGSYPGSYGQNPGGYPGSYGHNPASYPGSYGQNPGGYPGSYGHNPGSYPGSYGHNPGGYGQSPGAYPGAYGHNPGAYPGYSGYNGYSPHNPGSNMGYPNNMGGYPNMGGYGNYQKSGSFFGGNKYGGYGGYGGFGNYGMKKSGGFFGKHAFRNVLAGFGVWYLVSGLISSPFKVYSYYNMPREQRQEITLPANVLTLCNENATSICVPGSTAICTQDNRILCVISMTATQPCKDNNGEMCVNSTVPCIDSNDPLCQNKTSLDNTTTVNIPCFTNMTLQPDSAPTNVSLPVSEDNKFCVTSMAVPDPTIPKVEEGKTPNVTTDTESSNNMTNQTEVTQINGTNFEPINMTNPYGPIFYPPPMYYPPYYPYYPFYPPHLINNVTNVTINSENSGINTTDVTPISAADTQHVNGSNPVSSSDIENSTELSAL